MQIRRFHTDCVQSAHRRSLPRSHQQPCGGGGAIVSRIVHVRTLAKTTVTLAARGFGTNTGGNSIGVKLA